MSGLRIRAHAAPWYSAVEFLLKEGNSYGVNVIMEQRDQAAQIGPTFRLGYDEAQVLMDDLWNAGLRPTEGMGSAGSLKATQNHLEDMRRLVFNKIPADNPTSGERT